MYIPVLPIRINNKLYFPLCNKCATDNITKCNHSCEERCLIGTWCTPEIKRALECNYKIIKIYERVRKIIN